MRHEGNFKHGKMNGMGIIFFSDGKWVEGELKNNRFNGKVLSCDENGRAEEIVFGQK